MKKWLKRSLAMLCAMAIVLSTIEPFEFKSMASEVEFSSCYYLANGAIYQANKPAGIWGTASPGTKVQANLFEGVPADGTSPLIYDIAEADAEGNWVLELDTSDISAGYTEYTIDLYTLEPTAHQARYTGILFGEVWLSSGQSNMQLELGNSYDKEDYIGNPQEGANDQYLRVFMPNRYIAPDEGAYSHVTGPLADTDGGVWMKATEASIAQASAVSYHFARSLRAQFTSEGKQVPVAILDTALGSTSIESWLSPEMISKRDGLKEKLENYNLYKDTLSVYTDMSTMYYTKTAPLSNTSIAGMIWYQGCNNVIFSDIYAEELALLKSEYGQMFGFEDNDMPFVFSQLAPFAYQGDVNQVMKNGIHDAMRQFATGDQANTIGMVTNYDLSLEFLKGIPDGTEAAVIHPTMKRPVGERMALCALGIAYGGDRATAPTVSSAEIENGVAYVTFQDCGTGLQSLDGTDDILGFTLGDENGQWVNATARIASENTVVVYSNLMQNPKYVAYVYNDMATDGNLAASSGIPAAPFSSCSDKNASLGARSYLNCDEKLFVVTREDRFDNGNQYQVKDATYINPWTYKTAYATAEFSDSVYAQGVGSLEFTYPATGGVVSVGLDMVANNSYNSASISLTGYNTISAKIKNGDERTKQLNLTLIGRATDGSIDNTKVVYAPASGAVMNRDGFQTIVFDVRPEILQRTSSLDADVIAEILADPGIIGFNFIDPYGGTVWIDDIKLGVDSYWEPDLEGVLPVIKDFSVCHYLADDAIFQARKSATIWGEATDDTEIIANLYNSQEYAEKGENATAIQRKTKAVNGKWSLDFPGQEAGFDEYTIHLYYTDPGGELTLYKDGGTDGFTGILFGEVWLSAGQSNMEWALINSVGGQEAYEANRDSCLRFYIPTRAQGLNDGDYAGATEPFYDEKGNWYYAQQDAMKYASAVSFFFAQKMKAELNVPVAIVDTAVGSTPIESWLSKDMIDGNETIKNVLVNQNVYKDSPSRWTDMSAMYNTKIASLSKLNIAGMLWYQGESNIGPRQDIYGEELDLLKEKYGELFGFENDSMPFVFSQLAPYTYSEDTNQVAMTSMFDEMSEFYVEHAKTSNTVGMIPIYDVDLGYTKGVQAGVAPAVIHPTDKQPVAERMALSALGLVYNRDEATAPIVSSVEITNGIAVVDFDHVGTGLRMIDAGADVTGFTLGQEDADGNVTWVNATAKIVDENTVAVYSNLMQNPKYVAYAYNDMNTDGGLCASNGIPAAPFSTYGDAESSFGSRSYLNCDEKLFVVTQMGELKDEQGNVYAVGEAGYINPWTFASVGVETEFDTTCKAQGSGSLKATYTEHETSFDLGLWLSDDNPCNSATTSLAGYKTLSVRIKNGDARSKAMNLTLIGSDETQATIASKIGVSDKFQTIVFDISGVDETILANLAIIDFCVADIYAGTIWIDDIKLGVDEYWEPDVEGVVGVLPVYTDFTYCSYLKNGAVYQANKEVVIWGEATDGIEVIANIFKGTDRSNTIAQGTAVAKGGKWVLKLNTKNINPGYDEYMIDLYHRDENGNLIEYPDTFTGILFGHVWLSAGQSNMQLALANAEGGHEDWENNTDKYLKFYIPRRTLGHEELDYAHVTDEYWDMEGYWHFGNEAQMMNASAVSFYFARKLRKELDAPVAILDTSLGSTPIESWLSADMIDEYPDIQSVLLQNGIYTRKPSKWVDMGTMYNSKIAPLTNLNISGMIWYQGESNVGKLSYLYAEELDILKQKYGELFGFENDSMPFIFTQLAPYTYGSDTNQVAATCMQTELSDFYEKHTDTVGMVTNYDLSLQYKDVLAGTEQAVIHPTVKKPVGERMALSALGMLYGEDKATAPVMKSCEFENGVAFVEFSNVGTGLQSIDNVEDITGFSLRGENGAWVNAYATIISDNTVAVYSHMLSDPQYVAYANSDMNTDGGLCASNGIPAAPFSTHSDCESSFGSRDYLNCDGKLFVIKHLNLFYNEEEEKPQVGDAAYENPWTFGGVTMTFDQTTRAQGLGSVKIEYAGGAAHFDVGIDFVTWNPFNSATTTLTGINTVSVKMKNANAWDKRVKMTFAGRDEKGQFDSSIILRSNTAVLSANADFQTVVFDISLENLLEVNASTYPDLTEEQLIEQIATIMADPAILDFTFEESEAGTVWIDDIKYGVEAYRELDTDEIVTRGSVEFDTEGSDSYLKVHKPLEQMPDAIEARVKLEGEDEVVAPVYNEVVIDDFETLNSEWVTGASDPLSLIEEHAQGQSGLMSSGTGMVRYQRVFANGIDLSACASGRLEFDLYIDPSSQATLVNPICVEIGSSVPQASGAADNLFRWTIDMDSLEQGKGWYKISLPFTTGQQVSTNPIDFGNIRFFRLFFDLIVDEDNTHATTLVMDYLWAYSGTTTEVASTSVGQQILSCDVVTDLDQYFSKYAGWPPTTTTWEVVDGVAPLEGTHAFTSYGAGQVRYEFSWKNAINISAYKTGALQFMLYIDDVSDITTAKALTVEMTSSGTCDKEETCWSIPISNLHAGWNRVVLNIADGQDLHNNGTIKYEEMNYLRIYFDVEEPAEVTMVLDDVRVFNPTEVDSANSGEQMIFSNENVSGETDTFALFVTSEGYPAVRWGAQQFTLQHSILTNVWTTVKVEKDADTNLVHFYINGVKAATSTAPAIDGVSVPTVPHCIGADGSGEQIMNGKVHSVHVMYHDDVWYDLGRWTTVADAGVVQNDMMNTVNDNHVGFRGSAVDKEKFTSDYYKDVAVYREGKRVAPVKADYVFAGWYQDPECTIPVDEFDEKGIAYARWVDEDILGVRAQIRLNDQKQIPTGDGEMTDFRFVTSVDSVNYYQVGFEITIKGETKVTSNLKVVYKKLKRMGASGNLEEATADTTFCQHSKYFKAFKIINIPVSDYDTDIYATPFWVTLDGTKIYGETQVKNIQTFVDNWK